MRSIVTTFLFSAEARHSPRRSKSRPSSRPRRRTKAGLWSGWAEIAGRIDYANVSLRDLIRQAYDVKDYQVVAPDWMNSARFDVQAKLPPDTTQRSDNALMMQALLAERFGLKVHKESKEVPVYSLVVGKNGPKLKKAEDAPPRAARRTRWRRSAAARPTGCRDGRRCPGGAAAGGSVGGWMMRCRPAKCALTATGME